MQYAGAEYLIAPDLTPEVIAFAMDRGIGVLPGATTPTEILTARRLGVQMVKLFPTQALGTPYIRQIQGPIDDMDLVAVGGSTARTCVFF
jgi:2-dehydro-3-deoxyphosphogluconate aldolase/(4S)-4-hydroxy-2-oxoglutarate aldolase